METAGRYLHLAFVMTTVFSLHPGAKANYTHLWANGTTVWDPDIQTKARRDQNENMNSSPPPSAVDKEGNSTNTTERATSSPALSLTSQWEPETSRPSVVRNGSPTVQSMENASKSHHEIFKKGVCEENSNKMAMLICLIIIAVLFLICTLLFLSTVVLANKVSSLRRSKQVGKRQPRTNGDFLASGGLWAAESDTWKRAHQLTGPNLVLQSPGTLLATRERKDGGGAGNPPN
ncbi:protein EVI2A [Crocuta crocuta]